VWTPDDQRITFASLRDGPAANIFWQRIDGVGGVQRLTTSTMTQQWPAWHPSGRMDGKRVAAAPAPVVSEPGAKRDKLIFVFNFFNELRTKLGSQSR
jgi:Tol biopolymer transport system component